MREKVTHPATPRELIEGPQSSAGRTSDISPAVEVARHDRRARADKGRPRRPARQDGSRRRAPSDACGRIRLRHSRQGRRRRARRVRVGDQHQGSDARRSRARAHRAQDDREPARRAHHPHPRARQFDDRRPLRRGRLGPRVRAAVRSPRRDRCACADRAVGERPSPARWSSSKSRRGPRASRGPVGKVVEVLGDINEQGVDTEIIIRKYGIPDVHGEAAIEEALELRSVSARRTSRGAPISGRPSR